MGKFYAILGGIAVVGAAVVASQVMGGPGEAITTSMDVAAIEDDSVLLATAKPVVKGDPESSIAIMLFVDYQCPACRQFAAMVEPQIDLRLVESGRASVEQYDFPIEQAHPHAFLAARAARCAGDQDRYRDYHDILFRNQDVWFYQNEAVGAFTDYGEELGLDMDEFGACLRSERHAEVVSANLQFGTRLGVGATPTVLVLDRGEGGGIHRLNGNTYEAIEEVVGDIEAGRAQGS